MAEEEVLDLNLEKLKDYPVEYLEKVLRENPDLPGEVVRQLVVEITNRFNQSGNMVNKVAMEELLRTVEEHNKAPEKSPQRKVYKQNIIDQLRAIGRQQQGGVQAENVSAPDTSAVSTPEESDTGRQTEASELAPLTPIVSSEEKPSSYSTKTSSIKTRIIGEQPKSKKATEEKSEDVSAERHYNPYSGDIEGQVFESTEMKGRQEKAASRTQKYEEQRARYEGVGPTNWGFKLEETLRGAAKTMAQSLKRQDIEEMQKQGGSTEPKDVGSRIADFWKNKTPQEQTEQMIATQKELAAKEKSENLSPVPKKPVGPVPGGAVRPAVPSRPATQAEPVGQPPLRDRRYQEGMKGLPGTYYRLRNRFGDFLSNTKKRFQGIFGRGAKTAGTAAEVGGKAAAKGLLSRIGIFIKGAGPVAFIVSFVGEKLLKKAVGVISGLIRAFKGRADGGDIIYGLGATTRDGVYGLMGLGAFILGSGVGGLISVLGISIGAAFFLAVLIPFTTQASFPQFNQYDANIGADSPPPTIRVNKSANVGDNIPAIPTSGITYHISTSEINTVREATVTDTVKAIGATTKTVSQSSFAYSPSMSTDYLVPYEKLQNIHDVVLVNTVTVKGTAVDGTPFTATASVETVVGNPPVTAFSCPVLGGTITLGPKTDVGGHCGPHYSLPEVCPGGSKPWPGNEDAIDVSGSVAQSVYLPTIDGQSVDWTFVRQGHDTSFTYQGAYQIYREFTATIGSNVYDLQVHHLIDDGSVNNGAVLATRGVLGHLAGFDGGKSSPHAHIQISRDGTWLPANGDLIKLCQ